MMLNDFNRAEIRNFKEKEQKIQNKQKIKLENIKNDKQKH